ncbi:MAG: histidine phosphatase family protein [Hyphomicrobiales bacterium]
MRILEIRRHTMRNKPDVFVSPKGVTLAKLVSKAQRPFQLVVSSDLQRAKQTANHMAGRFDTTMRDLGHLPDSIFKYVGWPVPFSRIADVVAEGGIVAEFAQAQSSLWIDILRQMPDAQNTLLISHGLIIELGMVAAMPNAHHAEWGNAIGYCEGIRLAFDGEDFVQCEILRVPKAYYMAEN